MRRKASPRRRDFRPLDHEPVLEFMKRNGIPQTRAQYLKHAYPETAPDRLPAELKANYQRATPPRI